MNIRPLIVVEVGRAFLLSFLFFSLQSKYKFHINKPYKGENV